MEKRSTFALRIACSVALALLVALSEPLASANRFASAGVANVASADGIGGEEAHRETQGVDSASDGTASGQGTHDAAPPDSSVPSADSCEPTFSSPGKPALQADPSQELIVECDTGADAVLSFEDLPDNAVEAMRDLGIVPQEILVSPSDSTGAMVRAAIPVGKTPQEMIERLRERSGIVDVQRNFVYQYAGEAGGASRVTGPNDPQATQEGQYYLYGSGSGGKRGADVLQAWNRVEGDASDVTVALFDSGCRLDHEDLMGVVRSDLAYDAASGRSLADFASDDQDANGHGTAVAGLVGAEANNGKGIAGTALNARLLPVRVQNPQLGSPDTATVLKGISYVLDLIREARSKGDDLNLRIANMSFISYPETEEAPDPALHRAIQMLRAEGVLTVASGGNGDDRGNAITRYGYPSDFSEVMGVTALNQARRNAPWSDYNDRKDLSAPATDLLTTLAGSVDSYGMLSGTSGASPLVSGAAALLWAASPDLSVDEVEQALRDAADGIDDPDNDRSASSGSAGALNVSRAVESVLPAAVDVAALQLDPIPDQRYANQAAEPDVVLRTADGGQPLTKGRDYDLSYENNERAGTATVTIMGRGDYAGTRTATFEIAPNMANLVLVVRFHGDTVGDGDTGLNAPYGFGRPETKWQAMLQQYNDPEPSFVPQKNYFGISMRGFLYATSSGMIDTLSYFPQSLDNGKVSYITLDRPRSFYDKPNNMGDYSLFSDTLEKFAEQYPDYDPSYLDPSGDGIVENVTIIPDVGSVKPNRGNTLYPHKGTLSGMGLSVGKGVSEKTVVNVNVDDTLTIAETGSKVITHEFIHSLGIYDYYRRDSPSAGDPVQPVGNWDIMATRALVQPLAITRQDLGWTKIEEEKQSGRITLSALSSGSRQAVMFKSPLSDTEYFVAEYRKKGDGVGQIDEKITGSGVIVYRVNPAYRTYGNWGKDDYVYVFRQGETGLGDARGDIRNAQISTRGAPFRSSVGTDDASKGIVDGAIVLSDGRNTGIVVSAVNETDDSVTIDLAFPSISDDELWPSVENDAGDVQFGSDVFDVGTVSGDGGLYAFVQQGSGRGASFIVMELRDDGQGERFVQLGDPIAGEYLSNGSLAVHQGSLYFLATNGADLKQALLKRYDADSASWMDVAQVTANSYIQSPCSLASAAGSLYVLVGTLRQPSSGSGDATQVYRLDSTADGDVLEKVGEPLPVNYIMAPRLFEFDDRLAIACGDNAGTEADNTYLFRLSADGSWSKLDLPGSSVGAGYIDASVHAGKLYLLAAFGNQAASAPAPRLYVISPDGQVEKSVELTWLRFGLRGGSALEISGDRLYLAAVMQQGSLSCVNTYCVLLSKIEEEWQDLSSLDQWQQLGGTSYSPTERISAALKGDRMYLGAINRTTNRAAFLSHALLPSQSIISVTMPASVQFLIEKNATDAMTPLSGPQGQGPATFAVRNNASSPVRVFVSGVSVAGADLVDREEDLAGSRSLMMGMGDPGDGDFAGWLPAASEQAPANGFVYYPFNADVQGVIEGNSSSHTVALFGKLGEVGWEDKAQFSVIPTFTVAAQTK